MLWPSSGESIDAAAAVVDVSITRLLMSHGAPVSLNLLLLLLLLQALGHQPAAVQGQRHLF
jgi:hypothetical protein